MGGNIFVCDDQQRFLDEFQRRHAEHYAITTFRNWRDLLRAIDQAAPLPDLIVLDLYYPRDETDPSFDHHYHAAESELKKLSEQIALTKEAVLQVWEPRGIQVLHAIRQRWHASKLPVAMFSQRGLLLLDDAQIREIEMNQGHWLLKNQLSRETEKIRLDRIMADKSPSEKKSVFIGHGRNPQWVRLRDYLQNELGLPWIEFNKEPVAGISTSERLFKMLDSSIFAFIIMTGDDAFAEGTLRARQNVIHEVGLFQGRLGARRAIVLLEDGCETFSNIDGLNQIRFPKDDIAAAFESISNVLRREGML